MKKPIIKYSKLTFDYIKHKLSSKFNFVEHSFNYGKDCYCLLIDSMISNLYVDENRLEEFDIVTDVDEYIEKILVYSFLEKSTIKIIPPEGMEMFIDGKDIKFRPVKKKIEYKDIAEELFLNKESFYIGNYARIGNWKAERKEECHYSTLCPNKEQAEKLMNINKLINTANYFNDKYSDQEDEDLEENNDYSHYYCFSLSKSELVIEKELREDVISLIRFKTKKAAEETLKVLGKDLIISILK